VRNRFRFSIVALCFATTALLSGQTRDESPGALWLNIRDALKGPVAQDYFDTAMKDAKIPPLRGLVLSQTPLRRPEVMVVSLSGDGAPEATIKLNRPLKRDVPAGKAVLFSGVARAFNQNPFMLNFDVDVRDVSVVQWTAPKRVSLQGFK